MKTTTLKSEIREQVHGELGEQATVRFVQDGDRMDVRVSNLGVAKTIEEQNDDVSVTTYSEYRFTVTFD
jgi:hypothetical protein